ncbi:hypothetical protein [Rhizobium rhizogenes]|uniref:hypothetical protein n=1 Tax=Rhizobium rhizogenes TaxID=359 RepID=UPI001573D184|nr:hypothetical protein [Rhizobium rhizogenes]NTH18460.1 hypothetical protein [Rhizobium rhizogenes]NTH31434.1 hypothetical protein [Rhizobium rhizogenes]
MYDFGRLTANVEIVDLGDGQSVKICVFRDQAGREWHDVFRSQSAFDYYVALDRNDRVVSAEPDPEYSQVAGYRILGISAEEFGEYTRGPGGSVYGKQWDGSRLVEPVIPREAYPELSPPRFWKAAKAIGITKADVVAKINEIADTDGRDDMLIDFQECTAFIRLNPTVVSMAVLFNIPPEQLDALWLWAANTQA